MLDRLLVTYGMVYLIPDKALASGKLIALDPGWVFHLNSSFEKSCIVGVDIFVYAVYSFWGADLRELHWKAMGELMG